MFLFCKFQKQTLLDPWKKPFECMLEPFHRTEWRHQRRARLLHACVAASGTCYDHQENEPTCDPQPGWERKQIDQNRKDHIQPSRCWLKRSLKNVFLERKQVANSLGQHWERTGHRPVREHFFCCSLDSPKHRSHTADHRATVRLQPTVMSIGLLETIQAWAAGECDRYYIDFPYIVIIMFKFNSYMI